MTPPWVEPTAVVLAGVLSFLTGALVVILLYMAGC
jgi:hypothetical protein